MSQHSLLTADRLKKELEAQKARARARAYVMAQGCDITTSVDALQAKGHFTGSIAQEISQVEGASAGRDNTLEVLQRRKILDAKAKEQELKARLVKQQAEFREQRGGEEGSSSSSAAAEGGAAAPPGPLPSGWQEVADPSGSGDVYFWNKVTGETTWTRPTAPAEPSGGQGAAASTAASTSSVAASAAPQGPTLPPGWKEVKHAATGQTYYYHEETKTKRWTPPTSEGDVASDIVQRQKEHAASAKAAAQAAKQKVDALNKKRPRPSEVDPLDPTGGKGKWSDGMLNQAERMADSTAGGSLWQQRPLPAPGQILKGRRK